MLRRWALIALVALGASATTAERAPAQPFAGVAGTTIAAANALAARIRAYHRGPGSWRGLTPPPLSYCDTMREGEAVMKELARLASRAILYRVPDLALRLQHAGDQLSDELDEEIEINNAAEIPFQIYPCPALRPYPARAIMIPPMEQRMPICRVEANALRISFEARRARMQQCLRLRP
jgi:hypothetical protein